MKKKKASVSCDAAKLGKVSVYCDPVFSLAGLQLPRGLYHHSD